MACFEDSYPSARGRRETFRTSPAGYLLRDRALNKPNNRKVPLDIECGVKLLNVLIATFPPP